MMNRKLLFATPLLLLGTWLMPALAVQNQSTTNTSTVAGIMARKIPPGLQTADTNLEITITPTKPRFTNETPTFHVSIENVEDNDTIINLGMMLGNGLTLWPTAFRLFLIGPDEKSRELDYLTGPVGGRVDDYLVPLRVGSTHTLRLSLNDFIYPEARNLRIDMKPGQYRIHAELTSNEIGHVNSGEKCIRLRRVWQGKLQSDAVEFRIDESN